MRYRIANGCRPQRRVHTPLSGVSLCLIRSFILLDRLPEQRPLVCNTPAGELLSLVTTSCTLRAQCSILDSPIEIGIKIPPIQVDIGIRLRLKRRRAPRPPHRNLTRLSSSAIVSTCLQAPVPSFLVDSSDLLRRNILHPPRKLAHLGAQCTAPSFGLTSRPHATSKCGAM